MRRTGDLGAQQRAWNRPEKPEGAGSEEAAPERSSEGPAASLQAAQSWAVGAAAPGDMSTGSGFITTWQLRSRRAQAGRGVWAQHVLSAHCTSLRVPPTALAGR